MYIYLYTLFEPIKSTLMSYQIPLDKDVCGQQKKKYANTMLLSNNIPTVYALISNVWCIMNISVSLS